MGEGHPTNVAGVDFLEPALALLRGAEVMGGVPEGGVVRLVDCVADQKPFRLRRRELRGKRHGLVRGEHEVETGVGALLSGPGLAGIGAASLEERVEFGVARRAAGVLDADRNGCAPWRACRRARPPARRDRCSGVVLAGLEVATVRRDAGDRQGFGVGRGSATR